MGIDIEFLGTKHKTWFNIWTTELFCLVNAYALRKITRSDFNNMLMTLGQGHQKSLNQELDPGGALSEGMDNSLHKDGVKRDKHGKPIVNRTIRVMKVQEAQLVELPFHGDVKDGMAFAISVDPPIDPELMTDQDMNVFRHFLGHHERLETLTDLIGGDEIENFVNCNGATLTSADCRKIVMPVAMLAISMTKKESDIFWDEIAEVMGDDARGSFGDLVQNLLYVIDNDLSIRIT